MVDLGYTYSDLDKCCNQWYTWNVHKCSVEVPVVDDVNWYVNWQKYICVKNCPEGSLDENGNVDPLCGGISLRWEFPFTLLSDCCHAMLGHQHADQCIRDSLHRDTEHYTGRFYVNNREQRCARDCDINSSDPSCQGSPYDITVTMYDTPEECCADRLWWLDRSKCVADISKHINVEYSGYAWFRDDPNAYAEPWFREEEGAENHYDKSWYNDHDINWTPEAWHGGGGRN